MRRLTEYTSFADAHRHFSGAALWDLFDGTRERLNIAHECLDRWSADPDARGDPRRATPTAPTRR